MVVAAAGFGGSREYIFHLALEPFLAFFAEPAVEAVRVGTGGGRNAGDDRGDDERAVDPSTSNRTSTMLFESKRAWLPLAVTAGYTRVLVGRAPRPFAQHGPTVPDRQTSVLLPQAPREARPGGARGPQPNERPGHNTHAAFEFSSSAAAFVRIF